jgi:hypothetical protein
LANQLRPIVDAHSAIRGQAHARLDVAEARARITVGRAGFDALGILRATGDLGAAFENVARAFELSGLESTNRVHEVLTSAANANALVLSWASGDSHPRGLTARVSRAVAGVVGNAVLSRAASEVATSFQYTWKWIHCPCCGATPDIALFTDTTRTLVCWRCDTMWRTEHRGCLGCGESGPPTIARVGSPYLDYELAICNSCGRYLKERRGALTHHLFVERSLIAGLDEAAQLRGLRA